MLNHAEERIRRVNTGQVMCFKGDIRDIELPNNYYDSVFVSAVLHHLRDNDNWLHEFKKINRATAPGGSV